MTTPVLISRYLDRLTRPEQRLPGLSHWLLNEVWSEAALEAAGCSPQTYLLNSERWMYARWSLSQPAEGAFSVPPGVSLWWIDADGDADAVGGAGAGVPA